MESVPLFPDVCLIIHVTTETKREGEREFEKGRWRDLQRERGKNE